MASTSEDGTRLPLSVLPLLPCLLRLLPQTCAEAVPGWWMSMGMLPAPVSPNPYVLPPAVPPSCRPAQQLATTWVRALASMRHKLAFKSCVPHAPAATMRSGTALGKAHCLQGSSDAVGAVCQLT